MTAVEQFFQDLVHLGYIEYPNENLLQDRLNLAIEIEKEQHEQTFEAGYGVLYTSFEQYYSETYKQSELLNCPYCGSSNIQQKTKSDDECKDCGKTWAV